jgi:hypothetical protein
VRELKSLACDESQPKHDNAATCSDTSCSHVHLTYLEIHQKLHHVPQKWYKDYIQMFRIYGQVKLGEFMHKKHNTLWCSSNNTAWHWYFRVMFHTDRQRVSLHDAGTCWHTAQHWWWVNEIRSNANYWNGAQRERTEVALRVWPVPVPICPPQVPHRLAWNQSPSLRGERSATNHFVRKYQNIYGYFRNCSWDRAVGIVTRLQPVWPKDRTSIPGRFMRFFPSESHSDCTGVHPA